MRRRTCVVLTVQARQVEAELAGVEPLPGDLLEHRQLSVIMGRANVLDAARPLPGGVHDLHRTGPRRRPDRANVRTHTPTLVRTPTHATPTIPTTTSPQATQPPHNEPSQVTSYI